MHVFILPTAETCDLYCNAIQDAFELIQGKDEDFVPGFDAFADVSNLSNMSQLSEATPGRENNLLALNDSSIFTPNTHSKPNHRKTIGTSNKKSSERHSTPVRSDFCSVSVTPPSDLLCKPVEIRKNGGRKRSKRNGEEGKEQIGSESKKRKLSAEERKSAGRKSAERKSAGRSKKQSSVSELDRGMNGDAENSHEEDPVTKRLNFDTDHDFSGQLDILQVHHPPRRTAITYSSSADSPQVPSMDVAMSSISDTSTEHGDPRPSQGSSIPDRATTKTTSSKKPKNRAKKNAKSSKCAEDSSENEAKSKEDRKSSMSSVTGDQDTGALLPLGSLCEGDMTTTEVTMGNVREERKEERKEEREEEKEEEKEKKKNEEKEKEKEKERKEEENGKKEERHFQYESDSEVSYGDDASELESSESASEDSLPAINMEVNESVRGEFVGVKLVINAVGLANVNDSPAL